MICRKIDRPFTVLVPTDAEEKNSEDACLQQMWKNAFSPIYHGSGVIFYFARPDLVLKKKIVVSIQILEK